MNLGTGRESRWSHQDQSEVPFDFRRWVVGTNKTYCGLTIIPRRSALRTSTALAGGLSHWPRQTELKRSFGSFSSSLNDSSTNTLYLDRTLPFPTAFSDLKPSFISPSTARFLAESISVDCTMFSHFTSSSGCMFSESVYLCFITNRQPLKPPRRRQTHAFRRAGK